MRDRIQNILIEVMISTKITSEIENKIIDGNLYHVTSFENSENILKHDYFRTSYGLIGIKGLSTTYDPHYFWGSRDVQFVLDYHILKQDFELLYIDEQLSEQNECEIKVVSDEIIKPASRYIKDIVYLK